MLTARERACARFAAVLGLPIVAWLAVFGTAYPWIILILLPGLIIYSRIWRAAFERFPFAGQPPPWRACALWNVLVALAALPFAFQGDWLVLVYALTFTILSLVAQSEWARSTAPGVHLDGHADERSR